MRFIALVLLALCAGCAGDEPVGAPATTDLERTAAPPSPSPAVLRQFRPYPRARLVLATPRSRVFQLPVGVPSAAVQRHYERGFRDWEHRAEQRFAQEGNHTIFIDYFWRDGRCVWLHIGVGAEGAPIKPQRTMSISTAVEPRAACE